MSLPLLHLLRQQLRRHSYFAEDGILDYRYYSEVAVAGNFADCIRQLDVVLMRETVKTKEGDSQFPDEWLTLKVAFPIMFPQVFLHHTYYHSSRTRYSCGGNRKGDVKAMDGDDGELT